jgi:hypothetical protein
MTITTNKVSFGIISCGICHGDVKGSQRIIKAGINFAVICEQCYRRFSKDELELMLNMFLSFGGYFGQLKSSKSTTSKRFNRLLKDIEQNQSKFSRSELDIRIIHKALLHGIAHHKLVKQKGLR